MVDYPEQIGVKPDTSDMAYDIAMSKIRGLNKNLAGLDLEANPFMPHTGLEQPLIGGAGLPIAVKTAQAVNKDAGYDTTQNGAFYRISPKNYSTNRSTFTKNGNEVWPASPIDANGTGPVRYGDTAYDKTTYKPYKVMPSDEQNVPLQIASDYVKSRGLPAISQPKMAPSSLDKQGAIGATYDLATQGSPEYKQAIFNAYSKTMPDVIKKSGATNYDELLEAAYGQMAKETADQFNALPLRYSFHRNGEGNYLDSSNMLHDLHDNGHLFVFQGGDPHDFLHNVDPKTGLNENEKFRAVHDAIGHGIYGNTFKPEGEERAWGVHSQMYSPLAQLAMTAETRGQNSFVNYTPVNADLKEKIYKIESQMAEAKRLGNTADFAKLKQAKKNAFDNLIFAPQKSVLLPPEYLSTAYNGQMPDYIQKLIKPSEETVFSSPLTHYSFSPSLGKTDPSFYGTGLRGDERNRVLGGGMPRTYFYLGEPGTVTPEAGVGSARYSAQGQNLYNMASDPQKLYSLARISNLSSPLSNFNPNSVPKDQIMNDFEKLVRTYGYSGYAQPDQAYPIAAMFDPVQVQRRHTGGEVDNALRLAKNVIGDAND